METPRDSPLRVDHLDRLRAAAVLAVVAAHSLVPYMDRAPNWYVLDRNRLVIFDGLGLFLEAVCLPTLFFVAGCVTPGALARRGPAAFARDRAVRLLVPFLVLLPLLMPWAEWMRAERSHPGLGFAAHWTSAWRYDLNHIHLWFLPYLLVLGLAAALGAVLRPEAFRAAREAPAAAVGCWGLGACALAIGLGKALAVRWFTDQGWYEFPLLNVQPSRVPLNVGFFALGMAAALGGWFAPSPSLRRAKRLVGAGGLLFLGYLLLEARWRGSPSLAFQVLDGVLHAGVSVCLVLGAAEWLRGPWLAVGAGERRVWRAAYATYLLHYVPILGLGWLLKDLDADPVAKYAAVLGIGLPAALILADAARKAPLLRRVL